MDDILAMCGVERVADLDGEAQRLVEWQRTAERGAIDELHDQIVRSDIVQLADMRMIQGSNRPGFTLESIAMLPLQRFDRNRSTETRVDGLVHLSHAAGANQGDEFIRSEACPGGECQALRLYRAPDRVVPAELEGLIGVQGRE
jgi:hypothetical protein